MSFKTVNASLLEPANLTTQDLQQALDRLYHHKLDYADIYLQNSRHESWMLEDGIVKDGSFNIEQGLGVRAITGEKTGFAYADEISAQALMQSADAARGIADKGDHGQVKTLQQQTNQSIYDAFDPLVRLENERKLTLLREMDQYSRQLDARVSQVVVSLSGVYEEILVAGSDGTLATDIRPLVRLNCSVIMTDGEQRERGSAGMGGRYGYDRFLELNQAGKVAAFALCDEAVRQADVTLGAVAAPAGDMPVILGSGWPGVLLHEAVGHGLEGDFNRKGSSVFAGRIGEQVASSLCTIVDDGTLLDRRGSLSIDDEGTATQRNVLIQDGILQGYMQDKHNARLMGVAATGNGRRESYAHLPLPRMTNTFMLPGQDTLESMIASVERGIYAPNFGGGQVDITSGKFVFSASEAYLIENGQLGAAIKGATLIGNGPQAMQTISMVGQELELDNGVGICGKAGQSVPVGVGQPCLKLDSITVGGTE